MRYFKYDLADLSQLFIPWKNPEYSEILSDMEIWTTKLKHADIMYQYAWKNFRNGSETDSLRMDELVGAENDALPEVVEVDYEGFKKKIHLKELRKDVENYVSKLARNFNSFLYISLGNASTNFQVQRIFEDNLQQLNSSYHNLKTLTKNRSLPKITQMIAQVHLESYIETFKALKLSNTDIFDHLFKKYSLDSTKPHETSDVFRYLEDKSRILFEAFELKLIDEGFLNPKLNLWDKDKKTLVLFHIYCRDRGMLRPFWKESNDFLQHLEIRYNLDTGDQKKPGLWRREPQKYSFELAKAEFWFLQNLK